MHLFESAGCSLRVARPGCTVVRRIVDGRGVQWTVRELAADAPLRALGGIPEVILIFRADVTALRPESREIGRPLEALSGSDLLRLLEGAIGRRRSVQPIGLADPFGGPGRPLGRSCGGVRST